MRGLNSVSLIGNLGDTPLVHSLQDGTLVAKISVATTDYYRLKDGSKQADTEWHTVVAWRGLAGLAQQYLHKGSMVYVRGKLKTRHYTDSQGQKRYTTEIIAEELILLDKKKTGNIPPDTPPDTTAYTDENLPF